MIAMRFGATAVANVRFAISPLLEAMRSVKVLDDPGAQALHLPWVVEARRLVRGLDLEPLRALQPAGVYSPDFVHPPPESPLVDIEDELRRMIDTPPAEIRAELGRGYGTLPPALEPLFDDPAVGVRELAALLRTYWDRVLAPHWPRIRALLEGDVLHRARQIADGGAERLFADLDPTVSWREGTLRIEKRANETLDLGDRGLLFVPSVFASPTVVLITAAPWQPTLVYPARGVGMLWEPSRGRAATALRTLVGRLRASVLVALDSPRSTTDLARELGVTAGAVSQHLAVLRDAGMVHGHRVGRVVLYVRSPAGDALVATSRSSSPAADAPR